MNHLDPDSQRLLETNDQTRVDFIRKGTLINYQKASQALNRIESLIHQPDSHRMAGGLLHGPSNNGKTTLLLYIQSKYGRACNLETGECRQAVLYVCAPINCDDKTLLILILEALGSPYRIDKPKLLLIQVTHILRHIGLRLLIIDEFQQLLNGTTRQQLIMRDLIKTLSNEVRVPILAAGLNSARTAIQTDEQLFNRLKPIDLPRWTTSAEGIDAYRSLLKTFERWLPLQYASNLSEWTMVEKIHKQTRGLIGEIAELLMVAAIYAIESKTEKITPALLHEVVSNPAMYCAPPHSAYQ